MNGRLCFGPDRASGHCFGRKPEVSSSTQTKFWIFTEDSGQSMSMPSKGLSLSQWDSPYANRIAASLTSSLKTRGSSAMVGEPSAVETDGGTKVRVGVGGRLTNLARDSLRGQSSVLSSHNGRTCNLHLYLYQLKHYNQNDKNIDDADSSTQDMTMSQCEVTDEKSAH